VPPQEGHLLLSTESGSKNTLRQVKHSYTSAILIPRPRSCPKI
jgi:hypothetical protein